MGVVVEEGEAVAVARVLVVAEHRVTQAAGFTHNGHCAVPQGN